MNTSHACSAALLLYSLLAGLSSPAFGQEAATGNWVELPRKGHAIWVVPETGDVFASNGKVVSFSRDAGENWQQAAEPQEKGRHYNSIAIDGDWKGERLAVFPIDSPVGWMTLDGGDTWLTFPKPTPPQVTKHDGWTYGAVDWTQENPTRLFAKEHHSSNLWYSSNLGGDWRKIDGIGGYFGIGIGPDGSLLVGATVDDRATIPGDGTGGIYRSTDDGKTWSLQFECDLDQKVKPARYGESIYWPTRQGIAVSGDGGVNWSLMEGSPKEVLYGPFFGDSGDEMLVVSKEEILKSTDAGKTWQLVLPRGDLPSAVADGNYSSLMPNFGWDPKHNVLYATSIGVPLFRCDLKKMSEVPGDDEE